MNIILFFSIVSFLFGQSVYLLDFNNAGPNNGDSYAHMNYFTIQDDDIETPDELLGFSIGFWFQVSNSLGDQYMISSEGANNFDIALQMRTSGEIWAGYHDSYIGDGNGGSSSGWAKSGNGDGDVYYDDGVFHYAVMTVGDGPNALHSL